MGTAKAIVGWELGRSKRSSGCPRLTISFIGWSKISWRLSRQSHWAAYGFDRTFCVGGSKVPRNLEEEDERGHDTPEGVRPELPVEALREAVESYSPYLQASGEMHDPVFGEPTQYGTPYHALCNSVLAREDSGERRSAYADRAVRGLGAALDHVSGPGLPSTASGFDGATGAVSRSNHRDFFWPPILKTFLILRDLGVHGAEDLAGRISGVDIEASFAQRPPSNWAAVWLSGEWLRLREVLSPFSTERLDLWLDKFFETHILAGQG